MKVTSYIQTNSPMLRADEIDAETGGSTSSTGSPSNEVTAVADAHGRQCAGVVKSAARIARQIDDTGSDCEIPGVFG